MEPSPELFGDSLPILPQTRMVLLPHMERQLHAFEPRHVKLVERASHTGGLVGIVRLKPGWQDDYLGNPPVHRNGCAGRIVELDRSDGGRIKLKLLGVRKFEIITETKMRPYRVAEVRWIEDLNSNVKDRKATDLAHRIMDLIDRGLRARGEIPPPRSFPADIDFSGVVNRLAFEAGLEEDDLAKLLDVHDVFAHARIVERVLKVNLEARRHAAGPPGGQGNI